MKRLAFIMAAAAVGAVAGCRWSAAPPQPEPTIPAAVESAPAARPVTEAAAPAAGAIAQKADFDLDQILKNPWLIAAVFLLIQWFEIWYYSRTGRTSATIDAAEAAISPRLGTVQRILYRLWRWKYFQKHPDRKDPDQNDKVKK